MALFIMPTITDGRDFMRLDTNHHSRKAGSRKMTNERKSETQDESASREAREDRDAYAREILWYMRDYLSRYSVDFPLPWEAAETRRDEERDRVFLAGFPDDLKSRSDK